MAVVLEIRAGLPVPVDVMMKKVPHWEVKEYASGYLKEIVTDSVAVHFKGIEGNMAGYVGHLADILDRAVLVFHEPSYEFLREKFPEAASTLKRGGFGENLVVDHSSLSPTEVCIGDVFQIGSVRLVVTAPRQPCPKVNAYHHVKGLTEFTKQHGLAGYFLRVLEEGTFCAGSEVRLLQRPNPALSVQRVSEGLWGPPELQDNSREFLSALAGNEVLLEHLFRGTARERLKRLDEEEGLRSAEKDDAALAEEDEALASYNLQCILVFMVVFCVFLLYFKAQKEGKEE